VQYYVHRNILVLGGVFHFICLSLMDRGSYAQWRTLTILGGGVLLVVFIDQKINFLRN